MNTKAQGDVGVAMAIAYYTFKGYAVSVPLGDNTRYDLIVDLDGVLTKVQCKTTKRVTKYGVYELTLQTKGGNRSSGQTSKRIEAKDADLVFAYSFNGKCYELPQQVFVNKTTIMLGKKYQNYIVTMD